MQKNQDSQLEIGWEIKKLFLIYDYGKVWIIKILKGGEFANFKNEAGSNKFKMFLQKWIKETNAIGIVSKSGRYDGGTFAHPDIAFEFAS